MALPTNIFIGKAKASTPTTTKTFTTHNPWDQPALDSKTAPSENPDQTRSKPRSETLETQIKARSNPDQTQSKPRSENLETQSKVSTQPRSERRSNSDQTQIKVRSNHPFSSVIGIQRNIVIFVFNSCRASRSKYTPPIALQHLADACETTKMAAQVATRRLEEKGLLERAEFKNGRGGWTKYQLPDEVFQELLQTETQIKVSSNPDQTQSKVSTQPRSQPRSDLPIVVVPNSLSLKTTTTETQIPDQICFIIPSELSGMISRRQLGQFVSEEKISESELQMSLDAFAFDLRNKLISVKHTSNPVGLLIGAIKNNGGYNSLKFAEALKTEMKTTLAPQQTLQDSISDLKTTKGWAKYQEMKTSSPEAFQALISKYEKQGLKGELLEEFGYLEFQAQQDVPLSENSNPLRPAGG